jgi:hypothetical protein
VNLREFTDEPPHAWFLASVSDVPAWGRVKEEIPMRSTRTAAMVAGALAIGAAASTAAATAAPLSAGSPDTCISMNGGDWNACNVGNAGRGDLPYVPSRHSVALCIDRNQGDAIACRVGSVDGFYPS